MKILDRFESLLKRYIKSRGFSTDEESYLFMRLFFTEAFAGVMHIFLLLFYLTVNIRMFVVVNFLSVLCYTLFCFMTTKRMYAVSGMLATFEVCVYVFLSDLCFGIRNGVILFLVLIVEVQLVIPYTKKQMTRFWIGFFVLIVNVLLIFLDITHTPIYTLPKFSETVLMVSCFEMTFVGTVVLLGIGNYINHFILEYNLEIQEELKTEATYDPLTGLQNRRGSAELEKSLRRSTDQWMVAMLDIDDFKSVNDTYGHQTGDRVLVEVANLIRKNTRQSDAAFRWGGEEFLICLRNVDSQQAFKILEKIRTDIEKTVIKTDRTEIRVTVTMGVAKLVRDNYEKCIEMSDERLYQGKRKGKNRVVMPEVSRAG